MKNVNKCTESNSNRVKRYKFVWRSVLYLLSPKCISYDKSQQIQTHNNPLFAFSVFKFCC